MYHFIAYKFALYRLEIIHLHIRAAYILIHSFIHSRNLYNVFSRDYYSEALPAQSRTKKDLYWIYTTGLPRGVNLYITLGADIEKIMKSASAEGAKLRLPKPRSSSRLGGLRSVVSSSSGRREF